MTGSDVMRDTNLVYTISTLSTVSDTKLEKISSEIACASLVDGLAPRSNDATMLYWGRRLK